MPDLLDIPEMLMPTQGSTIVFLAIIFSIVFMILFGIWRSGPEREAAATRRKWLIGAVAGLVGDRCDRANVWDAGNKDVAAPNVALRGDVLSVGLRGGIFTDW
jgi:hypothetical protein